MNCQYNSFCRDSDTAALSATDVSRALGERSGRPIYQLSFHVQEEVARTPCMQGRAGLQARYRKAPAPMPRQIKPRNGKLRVLNHRARARRRQASRVFFFFFFFDCLLALSRMHGVLIRYPVTRCKQKSSISCSGTTSYLITHYAALFVQNLSDGSLRQLGVHGTLSTATVLFFFFFFLKGRGKRLASPIYIR
jgi:hypothetical protein